MEDKRKDLKPKANVLKKNMFDGFCLSNQATVKRFNGLDVIDYEEHTQDNGIIIAIMNTTAFYNEIIKE